MNKKLFVKLVGFVILVISTVVQWVTVQDLIKKNKDLQIDRNSQKFRGDMWRKHWDEENKEKWTLYYENAKLKKELGR